MHNVLRVKIRDCLAHIFEIRLDFFFCHQSHFIFLVESAVLCVFKYHICNLALDINVNIDELDNVGVIQFIMQKYFVFCNLINLTYRYKYHFYGYDTTST